MDSELKTWLFDIVQFIEEIEGYFKENKQTFKEFENDLKTKRAVERNLEIIGEAVNRILKREPDFKFTHAIKTLVPET